MEMLRVLIIILILYTFLISTMIAIYMINVVCKSNKDNSPSEDDIKAIRKLLHKIYMCQKVSLKENTGINIDEFYELYQAKLTEKILENIDADDFEKEDGEENEECRDDEDW